MPNSAGALPRRACARRMGNYLQSAMRAQEWLLIAKKALKYFLITAPDYANLEQLGFVAKMRWRIERDHQDFKQDFGLSHYGGQGWRGFHHHATLSIAAYGVLMAQRLKMGSGAAEARKNFGLRQVPDVPANFLPRGSQVRPAPCAPPHPITTLRILPSIELIRDPGHCPHCHAITQQPDFVTR